MNTDTAQMKTMTLTPREYDILEGRRWRGFRCAGQREAEAKLEKAFRRLKRAAKGRSMIALNDATELVNIDFIELLRDEGSIKLWKEAPPYIVVFNK